MLAPLDWERDGADWPNRELSRFIEAGGIRWHVQVGGQGPPLLLLHGTGASTHSVAALLQRLVARFQVVAPDLPGHAFTRRGQRGDVSLQGMARGVAALLDALDVSPEVVVGHSAGAAVLARMAIDHLVAPQLIVSLNGALLPFQGLAGRVFSPLAKLLVGLDAVPRLVARRGAQPSAVDRVLRGTGSVVDARQLQLYVRLLSNAVHVQATLDMMAQWDLVGLARDLGKIDTRLVLVACGGDEAVPTQVAFDVAEKVAGSRVIFLRGIGHLAHEERPELVAELIAREAAAAGIGARDGATP